MNLPTKYCFLVSRTSDKISLCMMKTKQSFTEDVLVLAQLIEINLKELGLLSIVKMIKQNHKTHLVVVTRAEANILFKLMTYGLDQRHLYAEPL